MLSEKNKNTNETRQLLILAGAGAGILFLVLLIALAGDLAESIKMDSIELLSRSTAGTLPPSIRATVEDQARVMGLPLEAGSPAFWYLARAGGIFAYILLWMAACWGIVMSSKVFKGYVNAADAFALHEFLPILGIIFAALHALILLGDTYIDFDIWQLLIPFTSSYEPLWTGLGSLAFYLLLALIVSFYIRKRIGQRTWRAFHYLSYLAFLLVLLHGLMAGSDSGTPAMRALYLVTGGISLFLLYYRVLSYAPRRSRRPSNR